MKDLKDLKVKKMNIEHRTSNIEWRMTGRTFNIENSAKMFYELGDMPSLSLLEKHSGIL